ncbi:MAG: phosphoribosylanthranilate isomerase [Sulfobacillus acidophilus]|uniref:N-(5'-phosphoribosyl)anthranilate isomerase n=1 Tax=Sulfobacillus acidophilus TaxID=53633 RepID=A0A2T2WDU1_9FIRM|nr:MAG: phosphoribosylanthranilate isomerase [Sulfobacillus acidophilus]
MATTIKICGIRDEGLARVAHNLGADFLGLVLTASRRQITLEQAKAIIDAVPEGQFVAVGRDVDEPLFEEMLALNVKAVQLHGRVPTRWIARAHGVGKWAIATMLEVQADIVLLDGVVPGSGVARTWEKPEFTRPIWIAGGLSVDNVRAVVRRLRPDGVDVSSGVEKEGRKDPELIRRFIQEVQYGDNASA